MPSSGEKLRALSATGRVANLPTVWSNVLAGFWLSGFHNHSYHEAGGDHYIHIPLLIAMMVICSMIYVAGCMLGDAQDVEFDREHRPNRPIPQGILSADWVKFSSYALFGLAFTGLLLANRQWNGFIQTHVVILGLLLITFVVTYAFNHKKNKAAALVMMASCRFLLVMLAIGMAHKTCSIDRSGSLTTNSASIHWMDGWMDGWMFMLAFSVAVYTLLLSWVASTESKPGAFKSRNILAFLLLAVPVISIPFRSLLSSLGSPYYLAHAAALAILYLWLFYTLAALKSSKPAFVSRALAGFCLLDACFLATVAPGVAAICLVFFALALLLQRITPAT